MNGFYNNQNSKPKYLKPNIYPEAYTEKQLLPKSLLRELNDEDADMSMNFLDNQMNQIKFHKRNQFNMPQPRRKVYSHQNVIEFNNPMMYNNFPVAQNMMPYGYNNFNNFYNPPFMMENQFQSKIIFIFRHTNV